MKEPPNLGVRQRGLERLSQRFEGRTGSQERHSASAGQSREGCLEETWEVGLEGWNRDPAGRGPLGRVESPPTDGQWGSLESPHSDIQRRRQYLTPGLSCKSQGLVRGCCSAAAQCQPSPRWGNLRSSAAQRLRSSLCSLGLGSSLLGLSFPSAQKGTAQLVDLPAEQESGSSPSKRMSAMVVPGSSTPEPQTRDNLPLLSGTPGLSLGRGAS